MSMTDSPTSLLSGYFTAEFPREGCRVSIEVPATGDGWSVRLFAPQSFGSGLLESYLARSLEIALLIARDLSCGNRVPRFYNSGGYSATML